MGSLQLENVTIGYDDNPIIKNLTLTVKNGELLSLLGPSGVGKTTLLKTIAGLLHPTSGNIIINGADVRNIPAEKRDAVLIFQKPLLFPFLDVGQNIGFGLKMLKMNTREAEYRIDKILETTGLHGLKSRKINQLSGGQQQRVALARGLVLEPSILLLDEPFSNLDAELRLRMRELIKNIQKQTETTMLFVTHDQIEALTISSRICLLIEGIIRQTGTPEEVFYQPADRDVAAFFGCDNFIAGAIVNNNFESDCLKCPVNMNDTATCLATIRPEDIILSSTERSESVLAQIQDIRFEGATSRLTATTGNQEFTILAMRLNFRTGQNVWLQFPKKRLHFIQE